jgi:hypothetical protein
LCEDRRDGKARQRFSRTLVCMLTFGAVRTALILVRMLEKTMVRRGTPRGGGMGSSADRLPATETGDVSADEQTHVEP